MIRGYTITQIEHFLRAIARRRNLDLMNQIIAVRTVWFDAPHMRELFDDLKNQTRAQATEQ